MSINERIHQLFLMKDDSGLSWDDISDIIWDEYKEHISGDACRKRESRYYLTHISDVISNDFDDSEEQENEQQDDCIEDEYDSCDEQLSKALETRALLQEAKDYNNQASALFKRISREESIKQMAEQTARIIAGGKPFILNRLIPLAESPSDEAILMIGDWHYGIEIDNYKNIYNPDVCKDRVTELTKFTISKIKMFGIKKLHLLNLGDMIAGNIHLPLRIQSRKDVMTQILEVSEIIAEMVYSLSNYVSVEYYQVLDNHSRISPDKKESIHLESLARITPWFIKERFKDIESVTVHENEVDEDIATFYVNNEFFVVGVHGDKDGKDTMIPRLNLFLDDKIDLICSAHLHHLSGDEDCNTMLISNGSLMGTDDYAFQKRLSSPPSQTLITFKDTVFGTDIDGVFKFRSCIFG